MSNWPSSQVPVNSTHHDSRELLPCLFLFTFHQFWARNVSITLKPIANVELLILFSEIAAEDDKNEKQSYSSRTNTKAKNSTNEDIEPSKTQQGNDMM